MSKDYYKKSTTITVEFLNKEKRFISRTTFSPKLIAEKSVTIDDNKRVVKYFLKRKDSLLDLQFIRISHNAFKGKIYIHSIEIQDLKTGFAQIAVTNKDVTQVLLDSKQSEQRFKL
jgi:hypothetical protein